MEKPKVAIVCAHGINRSQRFLSELTRKHPGLNEDFKLFARGIEIPIHLKKNTGKLLSREELASLILLLVHKVILSEVEEKLGHLSQRLKESGHLRTYDFPLHEEDRRKIPADTSHKFSAMIRKALGQQTIGKAYPELIGTADLVSSPRHPSLSINTLNLKPTPPSWQIPSHPFYKGIEGD